MATLDASYTLQALTSLPEFFCVNPFDKSNRKPSILYSCSQCSTTRPTKFLESGLSWFMSKPTLKGWVATGLNHGLLADGLLLAASQYSCTKGDWPNWWFKAISITTAIPLLCAASTKDFKAFLVP